MRRRGYRALGFYFFNLPILKLDRRVLVKEHDIYFDVSGELVDFRDDAFHVFKCAFFDFDAIAYLIRNFQSRLFNRRFYVDCSMSSTSFCVMGSGLPNVPMNSPTPGVSRKRNHASSERIMLTMM